MGIETIVILFFVAAIAAFVDAIAGGSGLITLPALLMTGIDPISALATNKFQSSAGTVSAAVAYARRGLIQWKTGWPIVLAALAGSAVGASLTTLIPKEVWQIFMPLTLIAVAFYFYFSPQISNEAKRARISYFVFCLTAIPLISFYDGVFGPGAGSFYMVTFVVLLGYGLLQSIAYTKLANAASNVGALVIFALHSAILFPLALVMAVGAIIGAQLGARCAIKFSARIVKPMIITVCILMAFKLLLEPTNPITHALLPLLGFNTE